MLIISYKKIQIYDETLLIFKYFNFVKFILLNDKEYEIIDENLN